MLQTPSCSTKGDSSEPFTRQGSLRRVLPAEHKGNVFGRQNEDINVVYKFVHQEYIILAEYQMVVAEKFQGIYVIPSKENPFIWFGVIFVRSGLYEDGIFRFNIILPTSFPDGGYPKVVFQSEVYHPVIDLETHELNLLCAFPVWNKKDQHVWQVVKYINWIFHEYEASCAHSVNQDANEMFANNVEEFKSRVQKCVRLSHEHLYDPPATNDKHYITFEKYDHEVHNPIRSSIMKESGESRPKVIGNSWVMPGSLRPLSRPESSDSENED